MWREALLAQAVLRGQTQGYTRHPQLDRFRAHRAPVDAIGSYLHAVADAAAGRGFGFDRAKLAPRQRVASIPVTTSQIQYEWVWLLRKLDRRDPNHRAWLTPITDIEPHPLFRIVRGPIAPWERVDRGHAA